MGWAPDAPPELRLLLACAAPGAGAPSLDLSGLDWERVALLAERHRMTLLLARALLGQGALAPSVEAWLAGQARAGSARALSMTVELARVLAALEGAGVAAAAYKGPALAVQAYGDPSLRWCSDLDVLVEAQAVPEALRLLEGLGFTPLMRHTQAREASFRRTDGHYPLRHAASGTLLELHCHVSPPRFAARFDSTALLARRVWVQCGPLRIQALAAPDLLLVLAVHGAKHRWARLEWLAAFAALQHRAGMEGAELTAAGDAIGAGRAVRVALELSRVLLGAQQPPATAPAVRRLARAAGERLLGDQARYDARDTADNLRFNLELCDTAGDRARSAWRWLTLPTPEDWSAYPLPDALLPLYRVLRPLRLLARYGVRRARV